MSLSSRPSSAASRWWSAAVAGFRALAGEVIADGRPAPGARPGDPVVVPAPERDPRVLARRLGRPVLLGLLASVAITYGASQGGSPFSLKLPGAWFFGIPSITTPPEPHMLSTLVATYGGICLLIRAWFMVCREVSPSRTGGRPVPIAALAAVAAIWLVPILVGPPLLSQDVYSYAAQGQMVTQGINPYLHGPDSLGVNSPYFPYVDQLWGASPAPYGPVFIGIDAAINIVAGHHVLATVVGLRLLALLGVGLMALGLPVLARSLGRDPGTVFALAILNPVTVLDLVGGAHNDALMLGLLVAGLALAVRRRPLWAVLLCSVAAAIKVPAALGVVYVGWHWLGPRATWRERIRPLMTAVGAAVGIMAVITAASGLGWGWVRALDNPSVVRSMLDPVTALGIMVGNLTHFLHLPIGVRGMLSLTRGLGMLGAMGAGLWLLLSSSRVGMVKAIGTSLLLVVVLGPVVQPWYLAWGIILLAPVAFGRGRLVLVAVTLVGSFIGDPAGHIFLQGWAQASPASVAAALGVLLVVVLPPIVGRARQIWVPAREALGVPAAPPAWPDPAGPPVWPDPAGMMLPGGSAELAGPAPAD